MTDLDSNAAEHPIDSKTEPGGWARGSPLPVACLVLLAAAAYLAYAATADVPRFLLDELNYLDAGTSLAQGDGLTLRGGDWGYGPAYPAVLALLVTVSGDQETTYLLARLLNAVAFAFALIPIWFLARRVLEQRSALVVVALSSVIPSTTYAALVMTEALAYLATTVAILLMVRAFERPTALRQLIALAAIGAAVSLRTQLVVLAVAWAAVLTLRPLVMRQRTAEMVREWRATIGCFAAAALLFVALTLVGGPEATFGEYEDLLRIVSAREAAVGSLTQLADLTLYLAVIPVVVAAAVIPRWLGFARSGSASHGALFAITLLLTALLVVEVGIFVASEFEVGSLHDRKLFYVIPLWLIVLLDGCGRLRGAERRLAAAAGVGAVGLLAILPYGEIAAEGWLEQHEAPITEVLGHVGRVVEPLWLVAVVGGVILALAAIGVSRARELVLPGVVALVLLANTTSAWRSGFIDPSANGAAPRGERSWVDAAVGSESRVVLLTLGEDCKAVEEFPSGLMTLFFNRSVDQSIAVTGAGVARPLRAKLSADGVVTIDAVALRTDFVVTSNRVRIAGEPVVRGAPADLVLTQVPGVVRMLQVEPCAELS